MNILWLIAMEVNQDWQQNTEKDNKIKDLAIPNSLFSLNVSNSIVCILLL